MASRWNFRVRNGESSWGDWVNVGREPNDYERNAEWMEWKEQIDCPHAHPLRFCAYCVVDPCPIGLDKK